MTEYRITFKAERSYTVTANSPEEAEEIASSEFDGFADWETEVDEI